MYKKKKEDEVFLVLLGHGPRPSVRRVSGSFLPSVDPHQRCRLDDCREQSVCPTAEVSPPTPVSASDPGWRRASEARGSSEPSFGVSTLHRSMPPDGFSRFHTDNHSVHFVFSAYSLSHKLIEIS